jgi:hypothetical protein
MSSVGRFLQHFWHLHLKATVFFLASFLGVGHGSTPALRASKKPA